MTPATVRRLARAALAATGLGMLTACANFAPVTTFAGETRKLTAAFAPMPSATWTACVHKEERRDLIQPAEDFSVTEVRRQARALCQPIADANPAIAGIAAVLDRYADTLAALADQRLPDHSAEFDGLGASLKGLKTASGAALLQPAQVDAIAALGKFLARAVTDRIALKEAKALLDQGEGFDAAADALAAYATQVYEPYVQRNINDIDSALGNHLPRLARTQGLAARQYMVSLTDERERLEASRGAVKALVASAANMKKARAELRDKIDHPEDAALWKQLHEFARNVHDLHTQVRAAF